MASYISLYLLIYNGMPTICISWVPFRTQRGKLAYYNVSNLILKLLSKTDRWVEFLPEGAHQWTGSEIDICNVVRWILSMTSENNTIEMNPLKPSWQESCRSSQKEIFGNNIPLCLRFLLNDTHSKRESHSQLSETPKIKMW